MIFCAKCGASMNEGTAFCPSCGSPQAPAAAPSQPAWSQAGWTQPAAPGARPPSVFDAGYATWATRVGGYLIDILLVGVGMLVLYFVLGTMLTGIAGVGGHNAASGMCCMLLLLFPIATLVVGFYNSIYLIAQRGFSIGQGVVKIKVVNAYGNLLTQGTAFVRLLVRVALSLVPFGTMLDLLWPLWDERGQTLHDKAVGCYVVNNPSGV
jgi:uncharacterized RDD family membrane protein YckC